MSGVTRALRLVLVAALFPLGLAAQDPRKIALLRGQIGVEPQPGSLLAAPARLEVARSPLSDALAQLSHRSRVQVAFSPSVLPPDRLVDCECADLNVARALDRLLAGTDLGYVEMGSQIVVVPKAEPEIPGAGGELRSRVRAVATMTGVVRDSVDLEPIAFALVTVAPSGGEAVAGSGLSDRFGAFVVPGVSTGGPVRIEVSAFGYAAWAHTYEAVAADPVRVLLSPAPIALEGLDVIASGRAGDPLSLSRDAFVIDSALLRRLPTIVETDVLRAIAVSPSASASSDYMSVPFIRGGASDGTPVLLDGVRLFNAFHLGGFISAINPEAVERATLLAGSGGEGLAVGSLSGAIDIATRDGSRDRMRMGGALGALSSRLSIEGPVGESVSFLVDGRRTWIDGFTRALDKMGIIDGHAPYFFRDLHAKVTTDLGGVRRLSVSGYMNLESVDDVDAREQVTRQLAMTWGNAAFSGHYRTGFGGSGILDATLGHSRFTGELFHVEDLPRAVPDTGLFGHGSMGESRADLKVTMHAPGATIIAGARATRFDADHDYRFSEDCYSSCSWDFDHDLSDFFTKRLSLSETQWRLAGYSRVEAPLPSGFSAQGGVRLDRFVGLATEFSPFAELGYAASWWSARISAARSHQALASVRNEESLFASFLAYDLLAPVSEPSVPRNTEFTAGWEGSRGRLRIRLDAYARMLDNLRLPAFESNPIQVPVLGNPAQWEQASGTARGIEATWSWLPDLGLSALGTYRWARVSRTVSARSYTPRFHREHELELGASYRRGTSSWSARFSLRSGQPVTPVLALARLSASLPWNLYPEGGHLADTRLLAGGYNSEELPRYARMDVGWRRESEVSWFGGGVAMVYASVANLLNRANVVGWTVGGGGFTRVRRRQLPVMPSLGAEFRF
ncbi:MAG: TonB-dependent receptor plug domain-containing protein [Gemmatimonadetes bacterium]|nr:TonB-dependent receptor plug domain-containing protein [Gemmatimonadota bacterium]MCY3944248.1 TonB-dependent receptor plug domain-containing protein [Gemmatimonadota bacterium]